uniref:G_PROTEIN_RECEP_F1_2 domain-containing protein n=1 Tax=Caenorhabditis tropicalis TaxID=1561998 RepID=A0A1I7TX42_9PELO
MFLLFIPILYIPVTIVVVYRIFSKLQSAIKEKNVNVQLFTAITVSHFLCLLFFVADFFYIRLPITGILTSWCASFQPNGYLVILLAITYHINYSVMLLPFLVAIIRLILIIKPQNHQKVPF